MAALPPAVYECVLVKHYTVQVQPTYHYALLVQNSNIKVRVCQGRLKNTNFSLWHWRGDKSTTTAVTKTNTQDSNISHLVQGDYDKQQGTHITQVYNQQGLTSPWELM